MKASLKNPVSALSNRSSINRFVPAIDYHASLNINIHISVPLPIILEWNRAIISTTFETLIPRGLNEVFYYNMSQ